MKNNKYSVEIANAVKDFLVNDDWHFSFDEQRGLFKFGVSVRNDFEHINGRISVDDDSYSVHMYAPLKVRNDDAKRKEMAEFICRANYGLRCGSFDYDIRDGELGYKIYTCCDGINVPSEDMIRHSLYIPPMMFDKYGAGMLDIMFCGATAKQAISACEKEDSDGETTLMDALNELLDGKSRDEAEALLARLAEELGENLPSELVGAVSRCDTSPEVDEDKEHQGIKVKANPFGGGK